MARTDIDTETDTDDIEQPLADAAPEDLATTPDRTDVRRAGRERVFRRVFAVLLTVFLLGGALRVYGVYSRTVTARGGGYDLAVHYAKVSRSGLATPFTITVRAPGGFDGPVRLAVSTRYLDLFDENGLDPDPSAATADDRAVLWAFEPPPGEVFTVTLDARIEPAVQWGRNGFVEVLDERARPVARVAFYTWVLP